MAGWPCFGSARAVTYLSTLVLAKPVSRVASCCRGILRLLFFGLWPAVFIPTEMGGGATVESPRRRLEGPACRRHPVTGMCHIIMGAIGRCLFRR
jgi:hypothetical protein